MSRDLFSQNGLATLADELETADAWDRKVLKAFLNGNRLTEIPSKLKKRLVILKWLAEKFEMGVQYPEAQVNELLAQYHPDYAALRRYLVEQGFMQREKGIYWRVEQ
jgi:hypothetical protein